MVFENIGDDTICFHRAILSGPSAALERFRARLGKLAPEPSPYGFGDRHGEQHLPLDESLALGRAFCAAEPSAVLIAVETHERDWERQARQPGEVYLVSLLNEYRAAWALIRQWTGQDTAIAQRDAEIQRLERLVLDAIYILQKAKLDSEAARLRRSFGRV